MINNIPKEGLFFTDDICFTIKDKTGGEYPNFYTDKITIQLFNEKGQTYSNPIVSKLLKVSKDICIYIPKANTVLTIKLKTDLEVELLHGEEVEIEYYKIYKGI
jgi:hypothetical protein